MPKSKAAPKSKVAAKSTVKADTHIIASPFNDAVLAAMFSDVDSAGVAAEYLVKDVLGKYGRKLGKVISVTPQDYNKLTYFRDCRVDVVCRTDNNEFWLIEFQIYDDEFMFERNLAEVSYTIIGSTSGGTTVEEMAESMPHIVVINLLNFYIRDDNSDWLQPVHFAYDKEPRRTANDKLEIYNIQLPWFAEHLPDFDNDGECWLYVMYQSHIRKINPQEVLKMDTRLARFATTNSGFKQFETRFSQAIADPDVLNTLRMETSERMRQAGMKKAIEKNRDKAIALNMLADGLSIDKFVAYSGLTAEEVRKLQVKK
jgi:predicted transposase/invertase (TIGR01784 family)